MTAGKAYREAEKRIEAARRSGALELDLSLLHPYDPERPIPALKKLPESLRELTHLTSLDLDCNFLKVLPVWIGELTQLKSLDVAINYLEALPESMRRLEQLTSLDISYNALETLPECLSQLPQLRSLKKVSHAVPSSRDWERP